MYSAKIFHRWLVTLFLMLVVAGCSVPLASSSSEGVMVEEIDGATLEQDLPVDLSHETVWDMYAKDEIVVIDVRQPEEYAAGHIPGARLIPLGELPDRLEEIPQDERVVVVCRSGNRSSRAQRILAEEGFDYAHNMLGGMNAWQQAGYDVDK